MPDAYARFAIEFEADLSRVQTGMAQGLSWANQYGNDFAGGFSSGFVDGLRQVEGGVSMLTSLKGRFANTAQGISEIFGMQAGADMAYFRRQLTGMIGDAGQAEKALTSLVRIANTTNFGNADIMQMAASALGSGTSPQNLEGEISSLLDASAAMGVRDMGTFRRMSRNFFDLRGKPGEANQRDVNELYRAAPQFVFQAAKVMGTSATGAREQIQSMSGGDLYDLIVKIGAQNRGRAAAEGMADPFVAAANAADQLKTALAPTGEAINRVVTPLVAGVGDVAGLFAQINKAGGGVPGVLLGFGVLRAGMSLYNAATGRATTALLGLALAAERAALSQGVRGGLPGALPPVRPEYAMAGAAGARGAGMLRGTASLGSRLLGPAGWALTAYTAADAGSSWLQSQGGMMGRFGAAGQAGLKQLLNFRGGGGWLSPIKGLEAFRDYKDPQTSGSSLEKASEKLSRAADKLADASAMGYGYGARGQHVLSTIEAGYALLGAERLGVA